MRVALVNPPWSFEGSIYFGCRESHLPLEYGYAKVLLEQAGHDVLLVDAQLGGAWGDGDHVDIGATADDAWIRSALAAFRPDMTVVTTAPATGRRRRTISIGTRSSGGAQRQNR